MKYLLHALLICGAFFSHHVASQETTSPITNEHLCTGAETFIPGVDEGRGGCGVVAPDISCEITNINGRQYNSSVIYTGTDIDAYTSALSTFDKTTTGGANCPWSYQDTYTHNFDFTCTEAPTGQAQFLKPYVVTLTRSGATANYSNGECVTNPINSVLTKNFTMAVNIEWSEEVECPEEYPLGPIGGPNGLNNYCYKIFVDEPDDCPAETVGDCNPPDDPECVEGGNGLMACIANPEDKCDVDSASIGEDGNPQPTYSNCEAGCGFVQGVFFCATEPDAVPNFELCEITSTGYVCPSNPDDNVEDPTTPINDMKKGDFKDVNIGIESRQNVTNDLLATSIANDKNNTQALQNQLQGISTNLSNHLNGLGSKLTGIDGELKDIGDGIDGINEALNPESPPEIGDPESWWESSYEDGIAGIWADKRGAFAQTPFIQFLDSFKITPSGTQPDFNFCFNLGKLGNFGCKQLDVPSVIWAFIKICMLISASFAARRIIFGG
jgi:hypothetical protein